MEKQLSSSWLSHLSSEFEKEYFKELEHFIDCERLEKPRRIFPNEKEVFKAFEACPFSDVKVVIIGQDPYPTRGFANGLCFSVSESLTKYPKSLQNIFKEIKEDLGHIEVMNGNLLPWAEQGVLLLNNVLTVEEGSADAHANKGWELFTDKVIEVLRTEKTEIVYLLWGSKAIKKAGKIDESKNLVLTSVHPSPLSAYRGFFGCKHFSKTNTYLISKGKNPIKF